MPALIAIVAAIVSIGAGGYLLLTDSAAEESTVFDALMHGIGAYFIARGLWMIARVLDAADLRRSS